MQASLSRCSMFDVRWSLVGGRCSVFGVETIPTQDAPKPVRIPRGSRCAVRVSPVHLCICSAGHGRLDVNIDEHVHGMAPDAGTDRQTDRRTDNRQQTADRSRNAVRPSVRPCVRGNDIDPEVSRELRSAPAEVMRAVQYACVCV